MPEQEIIAEVRDYEVCSDAFRTRIKQLGRHSRQRRSVEPWPDLTELSRQGLEAARDPGPDPDRPFTMGIMPGALGVSLCSSRTRSSSNSFAAD